MGLMLLVAPLRVYLGPVGFELGKNLKNQALLPTFNQNLVKTRKGTEVSRDLSLTVDPSIELVGAMPLI